MLSNSESTTENGHFEDDQQQTSVIEPAMKRLKVEDDSASASAKKSTINTSSLIRQDLKLLFTKHEGSFEDN